MNTDNGINDIIPPHLQPFLQLRCLDLPSDHEKVLDALKEAIKAIDGKIKIDKKYFIILDKSPFDLAVGESNSLICTLDNSVVGLTVENAIFLDYLKLSGYPFPSMVAIILEEFVHCLLNVTDHPLTKQVVHLLYPKVLWDEATAFFRPYTRDND